MNPNEKTLVLDFAGYKNYLIPEGNILIAKDQPLPPNHVVQQTNYVYINVSQPQLYSPVIDSYVYGEVVDKTIISTLSEGVYAIAVSHRSEPRLAQIVSGRLREKPGKNMVLWSGFTDSKIEVPVSQIAFLFQLKWFVPYAEQFILPR